MFRTFRVVLLEGAVLCEAGNDVMDIIIHKGVRDGYVREKAMSIDVRGFSVLASQAIVKYAVRKLMSRFKSRQFPPSSSSSSQSHYLVIFGMPKAGAGEKKRALLREFQYLQPPVKIEIGKFNKGSFMICTQSLAESFRAQMIMARVRKEAKQYREQPLDPSLTTQ